MNNLPISTSSRKIGADGRKILHYVLNTEHWEYREETGDDFGRDCILELIENDEFVNRKIEGQIKATAKIETYKHNGFYSYSLKTRTINYALNSALPFVLFFIDINTENIYYVCLQDYFIENNSRIEKLNSKQGEYSIRIPFENILKFNGDELISLAKSTYIYSSGVLTKIIK